MAEYDFIAGPRKGKVWKEKYYLRNNKNFIQEAKKYIPINSQWLTKEEFKNYIISLLDKGIPQIYVLQELPEELFPYALIFVQNEGKTNIYVDKEGIRTEINIGEGNYDAVNVVKNLPQDLQNNVIYYSENKIDEQNVLKKGLKLDEQKSYIYVCEDEEIKQVIPNVDYIAEEQMVFKNKTINGEDNTIQNLIPEKCIKPGYILNKIEESKQYFGFYRYEDPNDIIFIDDNTFMALVYVYKAKVEGGMITEIISKSTDKVYNYGDYIIYEEKNYFRNLELDKVYPILDKSIVYTQTIKTYVDEKTQPISDLNTKCLKDIYNQILPANKNVITDHNGFLTTNDGAHLYAHHYHYDHAGVGEVDFMIYSPSSSEIDNHTLCSYFADLGCTEYHRAYPAYGQSQRTGGIVSGVYVKGNTIPFIKFTMWVNSYTIGGNYQEEIENYSESTKIYISQVF